jgi:hypothetical protein
MSGLVIRGVAYPEKCNGCTFNLSGHCLAHNWEYVGRLNIEYDGKPEWCPVDLPKSLMLQRLFLDK